jgi:hypothetical protein
VLTPTLMVKPSNPCTNLAGTMPDYQCLQCTTCLAFQAKQVSKQAKAPRWSCAKCGAKQPVGRIWAIGTAKEIRLHVQNLSRVQGSHLDSLEQMGHAEPYEAGAAEQEAWADHHDSDGAQQAQHAQKHWEEYVERGESDEGGEPEEVGELPDSLTAGPAMPHRTQAAASRKRQSDDVFSSQASNVRARTAHAAADGLPTASAMPGSTMFEVRRSHQVPMLFGQSRASTAAGGTTAAWEATAFQGSTQGCTGWGAPHQQAPAGSGAAPAPGMYGHPSATHHEPPQSWQSSHQPTQLPPQLQNISYRQPLQPLHQQPHQLSMAPWSLKHDVQPAQAAQRQ